MGEKEVVERVLKVVFPEPLRIAFDDELSTKKTKSHRGGKGPGEAPRSIKTPAWLVAGSAPNEEDEDETAWQEQPADEPAWPVADAAPEQHGPWPPDEPAATARADDEAWPAERREHWPPDAAGSWADEPWTEEAEASGLAAINAADAQSEDEAEAAGISATEDAGDASNSSAGAAPEEEEEEEESGKDDEAEQDDSTVKY